MNSSQTSSAFSSQWYRVAKLHPSLRAQVRVTRQIYRDEAWYVLADPVSGRFHRMNAATYAFVGRCDGTRSVDVLAEAIADYLDGNQSENFGGPKVRRKQVTINEVWEHGLGRDKTPNDPEAKAVGRAIRACSPSAPSRR